MREQRPKPKCWQEHCQDKSPRWAYPFRTSNWLLEWVAWCLGGWVLLEVLEYCSTFSVLVAVILYFSESGARVQQRHYQAWQVINTAQGKGGNGGRIDAMQELNQDGVSLVGIEADDDAFLFGIRLQGAHLDRCDMDSSDLRDSVFDRASMTFCNLNSANFRGASLTNVDLTDADLSDSDLMGANLSHANLSRVDLSRADLRDSDLHAIVWRSIRSIRLANIRGVKNPPPGFVDWAIGAGAVNMASDDEWNAEIQKTQATSPASQ
ncbi:MAG: pentapeptide repeat-containing protein [Acidobacteriaceae bacterium]